MKACDIVERLEDEASRAGGISAERCHHAIREIAALRADLRAVEGEKLALAAREADARAEVERLTKERDEAFCTLRAEQKAKEKDLIKIHVEAEQRARTNFRAEVAERDETMRRMVKEHIEKETALRAEVKRRGELLRRALEWIGRRPISLTPAEWEVADLGRDICVALAEEDDHG